MNWPHEESSETMDALEGLKVLDLSWAVAGPTTARVLADYGATVVHVESSVHLDIGRQAPPFIDEQPDPDRNAIFHQANAGKLGISLDLRRAEAQAIVHRLAAWADVVIESFTPGTMAQWGLDFEQLNAGDPALIMLSMSLMGSDGPYANVSGFGNVGAAASGYQHLTGSPERTPLGTPGPYTDALAPRLAVPLLLSAIDHQRRTGEGCHLDFSQAEAAMHLMAPQLAQYFSSGEVANRYSNHDADMAPHGVFECRAGSQHSDWLAVAVDSDATWDRLVQLIGAPPETCTPELAVASGRLAHRDEVNAHLARWMATRTTADAEAELLAHAIPAHVAISSIDAMTDTQFQALGHFHTVPFGNDDSTVIEGSRYQLSATPARIARGGPLLGEHNAFVLSEFLDMDDSQIEALTRSGVMR
jgi:crotonobetainyl-CoA:carnitine CoA-transferase CaiB-like acyl-CoA transferase